MNLSKSHQALAETRAHGSISLRMAWTHALADVPASSHHQLATLAAAFPSPTATRQFARLASREPDPPRAVTTFLHDVTESGQNLEDWLAALAILTTFLERTDRRPGLSAAAGYLHCCASLIESGPQYETFAGTVESMLELYGYNGPEDS